MKARASFPQNGESYPFAHTWKFNCLIHEYKQANPFESFQK